jgi:hypothetical protein
MGGDINGSTCSATLDAARRANLLEKMVDVGNMRDAGTTPLQSRSLSPLGASDSGPKLPKRSYTENAVKNMTTTITTQVYTIQ